MPGEKFFHVKKNNIAVYNLFSENDTLEIELNEDYINNIPEADFYINEIINPKFNEILCEIFNLFSEDGKMTREHLVKFIKKACGQNEEITYDDSRVKNLIKDD